MTEEVGCVEQGQPSDPEERLSRGDRVFVRVPLLLPRDGWGIVWHPVTVNEYHSAVMGVVFGLAIAPLLVSGGDWQIVANILLVSFIGYSVAGRPFLGSLDHDDGEYSNSIGVRTIKHEPWWAQGGLVAGVFASLFGFPALLGYVAFVLAYSP